MDGDPPRMESRTDRLVAYLRHNGSRMVVDLVVLLTWILALSATFAWMELPTWLLYVVLFAGVVAYSRITPTWERPYRSPD